MGVVWRLQCEDMYSCNTFNLKNGEKRESKKKDKIAHPYRTLMNGACSTGSCSG